MDMQRLELKDEDTMGLTLRVEGGLRKSQALTAGGYWDVSWAMHPTSKLWTLILHEAVDSTQSTWGLPLPLWTTAT